MRYGSLFSGIGGFDEGFDRAGMECAWQVEIDKHCQELLKSKWNGVLIDDVKKIQKGTVEPVDLICGGFPCTDVSVAGKRKGLAGERSGLWFEFHRILAELKPGWCVIENVRGLLSSNGGRDFAEILRGLENIGYHCAWRVLDSQYFGLAQRRRRVFIVGSLGNFGCVEILFEPESVSGSPAPIRETGSVSSTILASGAGTSRPAGIGSELGFYVVNTLTTGEGRRRDVTSETLIANTLLTKRRDGVGPDHNTLIPSYWDGGQLSDMLDVLVISKQQMMPDKRRFAAVLDKDKMARRLTPLECERLQGFPDRWTEGFADTTRYKMLGNAVSVPVAEWIGKRIIEKESEQ